MDSRKVKVSKLEAARCQINSAIRLYFADADSISVHTLTCAAFGILRDLDKHGPNAGTYHEQFLQNVKPEYRKSFKEVLVEAQNFFKHADRDPEKVLEFGLAAPEIVLVETCYKYRQLASSFTAEILVYETWFALQNPEVLNPTGEKTFRKLLDREKYIDDQKDEFFMRHMREATRAVESVQTSSS